MSHYDNQITKPEGIDDADFERIRPRVIPLEKEFEAGHGRPDLDMLYQVVWALDNGLPSILGLRNTVVHYLTARPDDTKERP